MNFYPFHPGDYMLRTAHLEPIEDLAYRRLLDLYYTGEKPLEGSAESLARVVRMRSHVDEVRAVLQEFFIDSPDGWRHTHCDGVIAQYREKAARSVANGKKGGRPKKAEETGQQSENNPEKTQQVSSGMLEETGQQANQEPKPKPKPEEKEQKALVPSGDDTSERAGGYTPDFEAFWSEYPKRDGGNSKKGAFQKWNARLRQGVAASDLILSAKRYRERMASEGNIGTRYVKQAEVFLGAKDYWRDALASNVVPISGQRAPQGFATSPGGERVYGDAKRCPPLTRDGDFEWWNDTENRWEVRNTAYNDPDTGYSWDYLNSRGRA